MKTIVETTNAKLTVTEDDNPQLVLETNGTKSDLDATEFDEVARSWLKHRGKFPRLPLECWGLLVEGLMLRAKLHRCTYLWMACGPDQLVFTKLPKGTRPTKETMKASCGIIKSFLQQAEGCDIFFFTDIGKITVTFAAAGADIKEVEANLKKAGGNDE